MIEIIFLQLKCTPIRKFLQVIILHFMGAVDPRAALEAGYVDSCSNLCSVSLEEHSYLGEQINTSILYGCKAGKNLHCGHLVESKDPQRPENIEGCIVAMRMLETFPVPLPLWLHQYFEKVHGKHHNHGSICPRTEPSLCTYLPTLLMNSIFEPFSMRICPNSIESPTHSGIDIANEQYASVDSYQRPYVLGVSTRKTAELFHSCAYIFWRLC